MLPGVPLRALLLETHDDEKGTAVREMPDVMAWLRAGIPLTLLIDLLDENGPRSAALLTEPSGAGWRVTATAAPAS